MVLHLCVRASTKSAMNEWKDNTNTCIRKLTLAKAQISKCMLCGTGGSKSGSKKKISRKSLQINAREHKSEAKFYS